MQLLPGTIRCALCVALAAGTTGCSPGWMASPGGGRYRSSLPGEKAPTRAISSRGGHGNQEEFSSVPSVDGRSAVDLPNRETNARVYEVRPGDTLREVAARFGSSAERIREANGLDAGAGLRKGQLLLIPRERLSASESGAEL